MTPGNKGPVGEGVSEHCGREDKDGKAGTRWGKNENSHVELGRPMSFDQLTEAAPDCASLIGSELNGADSDSAGPASSMSVGWWRKEMAGVHG